jgi:hypothetical protein
MARRRPKPAARSPARGPAVCDLELHNAHRNGRGTACTQPRCNLTRAAVVRNCRRPAAVASPSLRALHRSCGRRKRGTACCCWLRATRLPAVTRPAWACRGLRSALYLQRPARCPAIGTRRLLCLCPRLRPRHSLLVSVSGARLAILWAPSGLTALRRPRGAGSGHPAGTAACLPPVQRPSSPRNQSRPAWPSTCAYSSAGPGLQSSHVPIRHGA